MKVRISMPGSYVTMELEEDRAVKIFRELSGTLLGIEPAGKTEVRPVIKMSVPNVAHALEAVTEQLERSILESAKVVEAEETEKVSDMIPASDDKPGRTYKGFLYIRCQGCGRIRGFCTKEPLSAHKCTCGHETVLKDLIPLCLNCECGKQFNYQTNIEEFLFDMNCINCGSPVPIKWNKAKRSYETIK